MSDLDSVSPSQPARSAPDAADRWSAAAPDAVAAPPPPPLPPTDSQPTAAQKAYWRANIIFVAVLLVIWFAVSCVCGVLLVDSLNRFHLGGFPLGFWFSQQGSVIAFIVLILVYAIGMGVLDRKYGFDTDTPAPPNAPAPAAAAAGSDEGAA